MEDLIGRVASNIEVYSEDQQQIQERLVYLSNLLQHTGHSRANSLAGSRAASVASGSGPSSPVRSRSGSAGADARAGTSGALQTGAQPERDAFARKALASLDAWGRSHTPAVGPGESEVGDVESEFGSLGDLSRPGSKTPSRRSSFKFDGKPGEKLFGMQLLTEAEISGYEFCPPTRILPRRHPRCLASERRLQCCSFRTKALEHTRCYVRDASVICIDIRMPCTRCYACDASVP